jgi:DNA-binding Lrp family transcriptional regulator
MSLQDLSNKTGITRTAVKKRLDRLVDCGAISAFNIRFSMAMASSEMLIAILSFSESPSDNDLFEIYKDTENMIQLNKTFDGRFVIFAEYTSPEMLSSLTNSFWALDNIENVDIYTNFIIDRGGTIELTSIHKRVLRSLLKDARMSISNIAADSGLTPRRISKTLDELIESRAVLFTVRWKTNVAGETTVLSNIRYNPSKIDHREALKWFYMEFEDQFQYVYIPSTEPIILLSLNIGHFTDMDAINKRMMDSGFIESMDTMLIYPGRKFPQFRTILLERFIKESSL